ncbi:MAG: 2-phosphosulfolactate phosphatase [Anaerolineales bacterium]|nr:2-phosphosulfolactate phosphatase [Anaerolineales bacterium]
MDIRYADLTTCSEARGTVVVIDVLRAFTTAAHAFANGASEILLVETVEQALDLRQRFPGSLTMGEVDGLPIPGFDFGNSPTLLAAQELQGRRLIQRTSAGTQGIVRSQNAEHLLSASFVCAAATARRIRQLASPQVTFVITGRDPIGRFGPPPPGLGDEDAACADYLAALLRDENPDPRPYLERVRSSPSGRKFAASLRADIPASDLEYASALDRFDFAMQVQRRDDLWLMQRVDFD